MKILERKKNLIKWIAIAALLILNTMSLSAQKNTTGIDSVDWAIGKLTKLKVYNLANNNGWDSTPIGWNYQRIIAKKTSDEKLLSLIAAKEPPAVRLAAMYGLILRRNKRCQDIILKNLNDISSCELASYDVSFEEYVENIFVEWMQNSREDGLITQADSVRNDSIIFFTKGSSRLEYVHELVDKLPCNEKYYNRLKEMYYKERVGYVLMPLVKFKKKAEKELVIRSLKQFNQGLDKEGGFAEGESEGDTNDALEAVAVWPNKEFRLALTQLRNYELTRRYIDYQRLKLFYLACLEYNDSWAYHFIDETLDKSTKKWGKNNYHWQYFYEAMRESPHSRFTPLIDKYHWKGNYWNPKKQDFEEIK